MARVLAATRLCALLAFAALASPVAGHGRLIVPQARNAGVNGAVGGGPGSVHAFDGSGAHSKYAHGICGNAAGVPQAYNKVGDVQGTYVAGSTAEFKVVITAHHVGFFEFELCPDASALSETCFMAHRLLREGCECDCPGDATRSCPECESCRRWWKPLLEGELSQTVTSGYGGPALPGQGNLVPYEYTMRYVIPTGLKTSRAVLRWHYMTTNSCTSKTSSPEEFWNCADVAVSDASGDVGAELAFDNAALESLPVEDLIPAIVSGELTGVNAMCPEDAEGNLVSVGAASDYEDLCGSLSDGAYERCLDLSSGGGSTADCSSPPASGILCESECSSSWFQCHDGVAYTKPVPTGTKCKENEFVLEAVCAGMATPMQAPTQMPTDTLAPTQAPTLTPTQAPTQMPTNPLAPTQAPTQAPGGKCGSCAGCLWSSGECYTDVDASYCGHWSANLWCGGGSLLQRSTSEVKRHLNFLGAALIQRSSWVEHIESAGDEL